MLVSSKPFKVTVREEIIVFLLSMLSTSYSLTVTLKGLELTTPINTSLNKNVIENI